MRKRSSVLVVLCLVLLQGCSGFFAESLETERGEILFQTRKIYSFGPEKIYADNLADGSRLSNFIRVSENHYQAIIGPESVPVNASAYYAFRIWSDEVKQITLSLKYEQHTHRYIPKLSRDGKNWTPVNGVILGENDTLATFTVELNKDTLWIAAQEVASSQDTNAWVDSIVTSRHFLNKEVAGHSVLGKDISVISAESDTLSPSAVLIARQHPPEVPGGSIAFKAFFEEVVAPSALAKTFRTNFNLYVFPLLNPDGVDLGHWRHNANGADLNRDWIDFRQPETLAVKTFIENKVHTENKSILFGIDFHTSYSGPYLLILNAENELMANTAITQGWIKKTEGEREQITQYRRRDQDLPYCYNWFFNVFGAEAVTYEDGDEVDRALIKARARLYAKKWMQVMLEQSGAAHAVIQN